MDLSIGAALVLRSPAARPLVLGCIPYPNPATASTQLRGPPAGSHVQLLDYPRSSVPVRGLAPGLYVLRATDAQGRQYAGRLVVE
ncbi:MAG: hypothetical protein H7Z21_00710 [Hymenobacter sp.]|nr:hypothetical protein [Hymenobacter sp.]